MTRIKILYISNTANIAGAEICLLTLVRHLDRNVFEPVVLLPAQGQLRDELAKLGIKTYVSPLEWWIRGERVHGLLGSNIRSRVKAIGRIIALEQPALVHSNTSAIWEGALAAYFNGIPHVWHLHEKLVGHPSLKPLFSLPFFYSIVDLLSDRVVAVSEAVREQLDGCVSAGKIRVIYNGVDAQPVTEAAGVSLREELGLPADTVISVTIGSLIPEKGYDDLLAAAALVREQGGAVTFVIVGGGTARAVRALTAEITRQGLTNTVHYLGYRRDIPRIIAGSDLLVHPSLSEAFSLVVLEAMASGKPVIATDSGGPGELVREGESGFIVPVHDPQSLCARILVLSSDRETRERLGRKGQERFAGHFRAERYVADFAELYLELVATGPARNLTESERRMVDDFMAVYQKLAEKRLITGIIQELAHLLKWIMTAPLRLVQGVAWYGRQHR